MATTAYPETVTVQVTASGRWFAATVKDLKWLRGSFDGASKLWTIRNDGSSTFERMIDNPGGFGVRIVGAGAAGGDIETCALWTNDQGCPLHGELCARGRN